MPLHCFTIVLDGMPWLPCIFAELNRLTDIPWRWTIVEGAAMNVKDTAWCAKQLPRLSGDGTTEFLEMLTHHPRITVVQRPRWDGKVEQCNAALERITEDGVVFQVDADEIWGADQLRTIVNLFEDDSTLGSAAFTCRYFVGPNITTTDSVDWVRAWRYRVGDRFVTHEPPVMNVSRGRFEGHVWTRRLGLVFDHHSYTTRRQCAAKAQFYGPKYRDAVQGWERLQRWKKFPTAIKDFFPWSHPATKVDRVYKE